MGLRKPGPKDLSDPILKQVERISKPSQPKPLSGRRKNSGYQSDHGKERVEENHATRDNKTRVRNQFMHEFQLAPHCEDGPKQAREEERAHANYLHAPCTKQIEETPADKVCAVRMECRRRKPYRRNSKSDER
jgi:hypothetical protein